MECAFAGMADVTEAGKTESARLDNCEESGTSKLERFAAPQYSRGTRHTLLC